MNEWTIMFSLINFHEHRSKCKYQGKISGIRFRTTRKAWKKCFFGTTTTVMYVSTVAKGLNTIGLVLCEGTVASKTLFFLLIIARPWSSSHPFMRIFVCVCVLAYTCVYVCSRMCVYFYVSVTRFLSMFLTDSLCSFCPVITWFLCVVNRNWSHYFRCLCTLARGACIA